MVERRSSVVRELPAWEEKALRLADQERDAPWLLKSLKHNLTWSEYAPLLKDRNLTWKVEKGKGNVELFGKQKTTLNRAIQEGWFAYGWDHPPGSGSGGGDGNCSGPCCILDQDDDDPEGLNQEDDEDLYCAPAKKKKGAKKEAPPVSDFRSGDADPLQWRFARAAFFAYFGDRAEALRMRRQGGAGSGDAKGVFRVWCAYVTRNVHVHANRSECTLAKHIHAHTHKQ